VPGMGISLPDGPYRFSPPQTVPNPSPTTNVADESVGTPRWRRGGAWLVSAVLIAVVAAIVGLDLPGHASRSRQISADIRVITQVNQDVGQCSSALGESFTMYLELTGRTLAPSKAQQMPALLQEDHMACSLRSDGIYQLSTIDVPGSASGRDLSQLVRTVTVWATSDAASAISQIQALDTSSSNTTARQLLEHDTQLLAHDRQRANDELTAASALLKTRLPALRLTHAPTSLVGP
jgi:hypothetical protein